MKFLVSLFLAAPVLAEEFPGRSVFDMTIDSFGLGNDLQRQLKGLYPHLLDGVRSVNNQDCAKLKTSAKEVFRVAKDLLKHGSDKVLKESEFDAQMTMMAQMAQSFVLTTLESQAEHLIDTHSCVVSGIHSDYGQDDL